MNASTGAPLIAVLGYSNGDRALHPICAARLRAGMHAYTEGAAVVLSGMREAALMHAAWTPPATRVLMDELARATAENAANVARLARSLGSSEVYVVTSRWHRRRAALLFRVALRGSGIRVTAPAVPGPWTIRLLLRELGAYLLLPLQLAAVVRS